MLRNVAPNCNPTSLTCPSCKSAGVLFFHGSYKRWFRSDKDDAPQRIDVRRVRCKACKHTHAVLPEGVIPYRADSVSVALDICAAKEAGEKVADICERFKISVRSLYRVLCGVGRILVAIKTLSNFPQSTTPLKTATHIPAAVSKHFLSLFKLMPFENARLSCDCCCAKTPDSLAT